MSADNPIHELTLTCQDLFNQCLSNCKPDERLLDWLEVQQGDFNLWAAGLKATRLDKSSLDYRARHWEDVRELTCGLLRGLAEALEDCLEFGKANNTVGFMSCNEIAHKELQISKMSPGSHHLWQ